MYQKVDKNLRNSEQNLLDAFCFFSSLNNENSSDIWKYSRAAELNSNISNQTGTAVKKAPDVK